MKKMRNVWFLIAIILSVCGFCLYYTLDVSAKTTEKIKNIQSDVIYGKKQIAKNKTIDLDQYWEQNQFFLSMLVHHENLEKIEDSIKIMSVSLNNIPDDESDFWVSSTNALSSLENLKNIEAPSIENIL